MKAMILAAGLGSRLLPYTLLRPKPLFPVLGQPLLLRIIAKLRAQGFAPIIVNTFHLGRQIVSLLQKEPDILIQEEPLELGTGGGLRMALGLIGKEPVLVTNGDIHHSIDYGWVYEEHRRAGLPVSMVMHDCRRFNKVAVSASRGVLGFEGGWPEELEGGAPQLLAFTGIQVVDPVVLKEIPPHGFYNIIDRYANHLKNGGLIKAITVAGHFWQDMGTPADYLDLHRQLLLQAEAAPGEPLVREQDFWLARGVQLGKGVALRDWGFIGAAARIGDHARLERVVVWDGAVVAKDAVLSDCIVT